MSYSFRKENNSRTTVSALFATQRDVKAVTLATGLAVAVSLAAGVTVVVLPVKASIIAAGICAVALLLVLTRAALTPSRYPHVISSQRSETEASVQEGTEHALADTRAFVSSRRMYYVAVASMGLLTIRPALSFTLSDWLFLVSLGLTVVAILRTRTAAGFQIPVSVMCGALLFTLGGLISSTQAVQPVASAAVVVRILYITLPWFWLGTVLLRTADQVHKAVNAWVLSVAICSLGAIAQLFEGDIIPGGEINFGRATGFTGHPNDLGGLAAVAFVPAVMVAIRSTGGMRAVNYTAATLVGAGLVLSGSVGALLAAAVSTAVWVVASKRARPTMALLAVLVVGAIALTSINGTADSPSPLDRLSRVTQPDAPRATGGTLYSRLDVYRVAWDHISTHPFVGVGLDEESSFRKLEFQVHNIVLLPWFTAGIFGVVGILVLVGSVIYAGLQVIRHTPVVDDSSLAISLYASFIAFVAFAMSEPILFVRYGWAPAAFLIALRAVQMRSSERVLRADPSAFWSRPSPMDPAASVVPPR